MVNAVMEEGDEEDFPSDEPIVGGNMGDDGEFLQAGHKNSSFTIAVPVCPLFWLCR